MRTSEIILGLHTMTLLRKFLRDESGATAIEYGLIAAGISLAIISIVNGLGTNLQNQVHVDQHVVEVSSLPRSTKAR